MIVSLLRHASTEWNEDGRIQGRRDVPLSARGRADASGWRLPPDREGSAEVIAWVSSPLRRAVETALLLYPQAPVLESALVEMDWGEWEGLSLAELEARHGAEFRRNEARGLDFRPPGGESPRDVRDRVQEWLKRVAARAAPTVAVTHKGVLRAVVAAATGWDMTSKPPVRLRDDALHRFAVARDGSVSIVACNVSLVPEPGVGAP
jgi:probable phosphoglycerate mutase